MQLGFSKAHHKITPRRSGTARRLNGDQFRLIGSNNFINEREKLVLNAFLDL